MKVQRLALICLFVVAANTLQAQSDARPCVNAKATIVDSGSYATEKGERAEGKDTAAGYTTAIDGKSLTSSGTRVKAKLGDSFGFRYKLECKGPKSFNTPMTIRTLHPPMTNPKVGKAVTESTWENNAWANHFEPNIHSGFRFDERWEMVPGEWTVQVVHEGRVLVEKKFIVD
jgi:Domain of unknown function (DUF3859)